MPAQQTRKPMLNKFSPGAPRASKFSDSEPGTLSPLQRITRRTASLGSDDFHKVPKIGKLSTVSKSTGNMLTRSISPLPPSKRESIATGYRVTRSISPLPLSKRETRVSLDTQNKPALRTRRLSEPKMGANSAAPSASVRSRRTIASKKVSDAPEIKKLSAIVNYDIAKIASLPELKIKPAKGPTNVLVKGVEKIKSSVSGIEPSGSKNESLCRNDVDETPVVEKTVVMVLPSSARSISTDQLKNKKCELVSENSTIREGVDKEAIESGNDLVLVSTLTLAGSILFSV